MRMPPWPAALRAPTWYFLLACGFLASCMRGSLPADTLVEASVGEPPNLVPMLAGESTAFDVGEKIFNTLIAYDENLELKGELAQSWEVKDGGKTLVFHLKPGLKWADGEPLDARDALFTYKLITDPKTPSPYAGSFRLISEALAPEPLTFVVRYKKPYVPALNVWATTYIMPEHLLAGKDILHSSFLRAPVGSNHYALSQWAEGERIELAANPQSNFGPPGIRRWVTCIIPDTQSQLLDFTQGGLDIVGLRPVHFARLFALRPGLREKSRLIEGEAKGFEYLGFNLKREPFDDVRVRQALNYAIDKKELISGVLFGLGKEVASPFRPGTPWMHPALSPYPYDPQKAMALLAQAGFVRGKDGVLRRGGKPFSFEILTNQNPEREKAAILIQYRLKELGIEARVRVLEWATFLSRFVSPGNFDAVLLGWVLDPEPDERALWHSEEIGPGKFNFISYRNPQVDKLLDEGESTFDVESRRKIYWKMAEILHRDSPVIYLYASKSLGAFSRRVLGIPDPPPLAGVGETYPRWRLAPPGLALSP